FGWASQIYLSPSEAAWAVPPKPEGRRRTVSTSSGSLQRNSRTFEKPGPPSAVVAVLTSSGMDRTIADELIAMAELDQKVADELATSGALYEGYHPRMVAIHETNAARLQAIIAEIGWPTERLVGKEAAQAAWLIAQHAISKPEFQRACLKHLAEASREHAAPL